MSNGKLAMSFDIEADGDSPAENSMLSFGVSGRDEKGNEVIARKWNIKQLADKRMDPRCKAEFWDRNPIAWQKATENQVEATQFVSELSQVLIEYQPKHKIIWVAKPAAYDWQWLNYYYNRFKTPNAPYLGFKAVCISTMFDTYCKVNKIPKNKEKEVENQLTESTSLTHDALEDARVQGLMYFKLNAFFQ